MHAAGLLNSCLPNQGDSLLSGAAWHVVCTKAMYTRQALFIEASNAVQLYYVLQSRESAWDMLVVVTCLLPLRNLPFYAYEAELDVQNSHRCIQKLRISHGFRSDCVCRQTGG